MNLFVNILKQILYLLNYCKSFSKLKVNIRKTTIQSGRTFALTHGVRASKGLITAF